MRFRLGGRRRESPKDDVDSVSDATPSLAPIIVVGLTWRTGSTAMQRALNATGHVLVWGEPWHDSHRLQPLRLAHDELPEVEGVPGLGGWDPASLARHWTALLAPAREDFARGATSLYLETYARPALRLGRQRWGLKDVHLDGEDLTWLKHLFPDARFVVMDREPVETWNSYAAMPGVRVTPWKQPGPTGAVTRADQFAELWRHRAESLRCFEAANRDRVLRVPHARARTRGDLVAASVARFVGLPDDAARLAAAVLTESAPKARPSALHATSEAEADLIVSICSDEAQRWGYRLDQGRLGSTE